MKEYKEILKEHKLKIKKFKNLILEVNKTAKEIKNNYNTLDKTKDKIENYTKNDLEDWIENIYENSKCKTDFIYVREEKLIEKERENWRDLSYDFYNEMSNINHKIYLQEIDGEVFEELKRNWDYKDIY